MRKRRGFPSGSFRNGAFGFEKWICEVNTKLRGEVNGKGGEDKGIKLRKRLR
jgi:hypothetical protein